MLLYIVRHGDPNYKDNVLTPLGVEQARALARRFAVHGLDQIFCSPLGRARETARYTCELLKKEPQIEHWMSEDLAAARFSSFEGGRRRWMSAVLRESMYAEENVLPLSRWKEAPMFDDHPEAKDGYDALIASSDDFFRRLGFEREGGLYRLTGKDPGRVAAFCHAGFGGTWMSHLLSLPPQIFWRNMDCMETSSFHIIQFVPDKSGLCPPRALTLSSTPHIYDERLPLGY